MNKVKNLMLLSKNRTNMRLGNQPNFRLRILPSVKFVLSSALNSNQMVSKGKYIVIKRQKICFESSSSIFAAVLKDENII